MQPHFQTNRNHFVDLWTQNAIAGVSPHHLVLFRRCRCFYTLFTACQIPLMEEVQQSSSMEGSYSISKVAQCKQDTDSMCTTKVKHVCLPFVSLVPLQKSSTEFNKRRTKVASWKLILTNKYFWWDNGKTCKKVTLNPTAFFHKGMKWQSPILHKKTKEIYSIP